MRTILVTGATGFIGRNLLAELIRSDDYKVRAVIRRETDLDKRIEQVCGDLADETFLAKALRNVDVVVHLAALRPGKSGYPEDCWRVNYLLTGKLLEESAENRIEHFIFCSSVGVTGWRGELPMSENTPFDPVGPYHEAKAAAERLVLTYNDVLPVTIVRPTITYGPGDKDGLVAKIFQLVAKGVFVFVGNGRNCLHLSYIGNIVNGFSLILRQRGCGKTYILADEKEMTMRELVDFISTLLGVSYNKIFLPYRLAKGAMILYQRLGEKAPSTSLPKGTVESVDILSRNRRYSIAAAREFGYDPEFSTIEGLEVSASWYNQLINQR
jgi:nucleoside-diphosphate-sugar epimerase